MGDNEGLGFDHLCCGLQSLKGTPSQSRCLGDFRQVGQCRIGYDHDDVVDDGTAAVVLIGGGGDVVIFYAYIGNNHSYLHAITTKHLLTHF